MRIPRSRGAISGILLVILGAWVAIIPFVGPLFDYSVGSTAAWDWTLGRFWLNVLPGAITIVAGLALVGTGRRISLGAAGWLATVAGGWIVVGPEVSRIWNNGVAQSGAAYGGVHRQVVELLGFSLLSGAAIAALGAFSVGRASLASVDDVRADLAARQAALPPDESTGEPAGQSTDEASLATPDAHWSPLRHRRGRIRRHTVEAGELQSPATAESAPPPPPAPSEPPRH